MGAIGCARCAGLASPLSLPRPTDLSSRLGSRLAGALPAGALLGAGQENAALCDLVPARAAVPPLGVARRGAAWRVLEPPWHSGWGQGASLLYRVIVALYFIYDQNSSGARAKQKQNESRSVA